MGRRRPPAEASRDCVPGAQLPPCVLVGVHLPPDGGVGNATAPESDLGTPGRRHRLPIPPGRPRLHLHYWLRRGGPSRGRRCASQPVPMPARERPLRATPADGPPGGIGLAGHPRSAPPGPDPRPILPPLQPPPAPPVTWSTPARPSGRMATRPRCRDRQDPRRRRLDKRVPPRGLRRRRYATVRSS